MIFHEFPEWCTERLLLRKITLDDAEDIFAFRSDPEVMRYIPRPIAQTIDDIIYLIQMIHDFYDKGQRINWGIAKKENNRLIGMIGFVNIKEEHFRAEVGYILHQDYHRKGYMLEALLSTMAYGFKKMNLHSIEAIVDAQNIASKQLLLKAGFRQEAYYVEDFYHNLSFRNSIHYGLLASEFRVHA